MQSKAVIRSGGSKGKLPGSDFSSDWKESRKTEREGAWEGFMAKGWQQNNSTGQMMVSKTTEPPHVELVGPCLTPYTRLPQNGSNQGPFHDHRWAVVQAHSHEK